MRYSGMVVDGCLAGQFVEHYQETYEYVIQDDGDMLLAPGIVAEDISRTTKTLRAVPIHVEGEEIWFWVNVRLPKDGQIQYVIQRLITMAMRK